MFGLLDVCFPLRDKDRLRVVFITEFWLLHLFLEYLYMLFLLNAARSLLNEMQRFSCRQSSGVTFWHASVSKAEFPPFIWEGRQDHFGSMQRQVYLDYSKTFDGWANKLGRMLHSVMLSLGLERSQANFLESIKYVFSLQMLVSAKIFFPGFDNCVFPDLHYFHLSAIVAMLHVFHCCHGQ